MTRRFGLDKANGKFLGVCAGIARWMNVDATFVRVAAVLLTVVGGFPWTVVAYFGAAWLGGRTPRAAGYGARTSTAQLRGSMDDIDRRLATIDAYVAGQDSRLAREIEELR